MATVATLNGKRVSLSVEEKARLLTVSVIPGEHAFKVSSGSKPGRTYKVTHDGRYATGCECESCGGRCCHRVAVNNRLQAERDEERTRYNYYLLGIGA